MTRFFSTDADVFVSGDLKYHDAKDAEVFQRGLIDVGHFASEELMIGLIAARLDAMLSEKGFDVRVEALGKEADPFKYI